MASSSKVVGVVLVSLGIGGLGFVVVPAIIRAVRGGQVELGGVSYTPLGGHLTEVDVELVNPGKATATFGAQGAVISGSGVIAGHLWTTQQAAQQATQLYQQGGEATVAAMQRDPSLRVATVQLAGGASGTARLYLAPLAGGTYDIFVWAMQSPPSGQLIAQDALGAVADTVPSLTPVKGRGQVRVA